MKITDIYYFSGTHWDREWYQTFQGFRHRLVDMVDELLDYMENNPEYGTYHFDGQTIVLEDYTEIAPENEGRIRKLIADGRMKIGPWYNMPDEFLLSGESLIRNLMVGARLAKKWGAEPWKWGYICDIFGHIAQTPQIFAGFDINYSTLGRGTDENAPTFFKWQAPDNSECINFRLEPQDGYGSFCMHVKIQDKTDEQAKEIIKAYMDKEMARSNTNIVILMDAIDHQKVNKETTRTFRLLKELYPEINLHHCDLCEAGKELDKIKESLPTIAGELNKTSIDKHSYLHLITNTLSSYYTHKKANDECQNLLEKVIEPIAAYSALNGQKIRRSYVNLAYKHLLQNHPHDSICGCSIDQVHKDMVYRFDQVKEISTTLSQRFVYDNRPESGNSNDYILKLYNPLPFERKECVTASITLKEDYPAKYAEPFDYEDIFSFKIIDNKGNEIPYERKAMRKAYMDTPCDDITYKGEEYTITFLADMPACGYCEYKIVPSERPVRYLKKMFSGNNFAENEFIRMEISNNGEISILDKQTNKLYKDLASFIDDGEIGDGWYHANPVNDIIVYSHASGARVEKIENGPSRCVFRITKYMDVPAEMLNTNFGYVRSENYVKLPIVMEVGVSEGARYADFKMTIDNIAKDHRLRLLLPTGIDNKSYFAGQAFYCNKRATGIDYKTQNQREHEQYEKQMNGIVGKRDKDGTGIAFVSAAGLHECAGYDDGNIMVTLLRAFKRTVHSVVGGTNGQMLGKLDYEFLLAPLDKSVTYSSLVKLQDILAVKPLYSASEVGEGYVPTQKSAMQLIGESLNLSIVKVPEDEENNSIIVRVFNASANNADGKLIFDKDISSAVMTNLNEDIKENASFNGNTLNISLTPWKIGTYKLTF